MFYLILAKFVVHKDLLSFSGGTHRPGKLRSNFAIAHWPTHVANFHTWSLTVMLTLLFISTYVLHMSAAWRLASLTKKFWLCWSFRFHEHYLLLREILPFIAQLFSILMLIKYLLWLYQMKCFKEMFSQSAAIGILIFLSGFSLRLMYILFFHLHGLCLLTIMYLLMGAPTQQNLEVQS